MHSKKITLKLTVIEYVLDMICVDAACKHPAPFTHGNVWACSGAAHSAQVTASVLIYQVSESHTNGPSSHHIRQIKPQSHAHQEK